MTVRFYLLDALGDIPADLTEAILDEFEAAREKACALLPVDRVDVVVAPSSFVIPRLGMSGFTHTKSRVTISVNPASPRLADTERGERLLGTLAHELHHVRRLRGTNFSRTLGGRFVNEGLAQCFEEEAGAPTPFYATALDAETLARMAARALPLREATEFDYDRWLYGRDDDPDWPRHTGYALGYALVRAWLAKNATTASAAVDVPAAEILDAWAAGEISV
jgi:uncharacterized protein YjaZ